MNTIVLQKKNMKLLKQNDGRTDTGHQVLCFGSPFNAAHSSNSTRRPVTFSWTSDPSAATVDTTVYCDYGLYGGFGKPGRKIAWLAESPALVDSFNIRSFIINNMDAITTSYEILLSSDRSLCELHPQFLYHPAGSNLPWIDEFDYQIYPKTILCSMFASGKTMFEGHHYRHEIACKFKDQLDLYGGSNRSPRIGGLGAHPDKRKGLIPYYFSITMENSQTPFYYSEKISDCFATGTVPVYWGADEITTIFDAEGIIPLTEDFDISSLSESLYHELLPAIGNNFDIVRNLESADDMLFRKYIL